MKKLMKKRAGFTLVELLIVIIIIGILAGAMLLVAGSGTDKAEATKIVSDLRGLKAAALMYYADNPSETSVPADQIKSLKKYMDRDIDETLYDFEDGSTAGEWWVSRQTKIASGVADKLLAVAEETGLFGGTASGDAYTGGADTPVYMRAR